MFSGLRINAFSARVMLGLSLLLGGTATVQAQEIHKQCGTDILWDKHAEQNPELLKVRETANELALYSGPLRKADDTTVKIIPVVFHVLHTYGAENISKEQIEEQILTLNEAFRKKNRDTINISPLFKDLAADARVEFRLAKKDPNGNCTDGILRIYTTQTTNAWDNVKSISRWDNKKYLNIWVVKSINSQGVSNGIIAGFAQFPWEASSAASTDGIVVDYRYVGRGKNTLVHEAGHYFGLFHTFQDGCSGSNCLYSGDRICDTPPVLKANFGCNKGINTCATDNPNLPDMIENYMDYTDCTYMFTKGQKERMDNMFVNYRSQLISASNAVATGVDGTFNADYCKPKADFYNTTYVICEGDSIRFFDNSYNSTVTNYEWTFAGGYPQTETAKNPAIKYSQSGTYTATLKVSNPAGTDVTSKQVTIKVLPSISDFKSPVTEGFETINLANNGWTVNSDAKGIQWKKTTSAAYNGSNSLYINNFSGTANTLYYFTIPPVDLSTAKEPKMKFRLAYVQESSTTSEFLRVYVSMDCGKTFLRVYNKGGRFLATNPAYFTTSYVPAPGDWREETIDLTSIKSATNAIFKFELTSEGGNNLYIDDLNIGGTAVTSVNEPNNSDKTTFDVYPNPAKESFTLQIESPKAEKGQLSVFDMSGRELYFIPQFNINSGSQKVILQRRDLNINSAGMYYIKLSAGSSTLMKKVVITE